MRTSVVIQILLGAGALAHPHFKLNNPLAHVHHKRQQPAEVLTTTVGNQVDIEEIFIATVWGPSPPSTTTPAPTTTPAVVVAAPEKLAVAPVANNQSWNHDSHTPASVTPASVTQASITPPVTPVSVTPVQSSAVPALTGSSNDGAPKSGGISILETANKYRAMMGYSAFTYSSTLAANSAKTNADNGANSMHHELNSGSAAQCISEADNNSGSNGLSPFELIYLVWLCEIQDARIDAVCAEMTTATNIQYTIGDTDHAQILRRPSYSTIGCNYLTSTEHHDNYAGIWTCDFS